MKQMTSINLLSKEEAMSRMNRYGREAVPFFFVIDFDEARCIVEKTEELSSGEVQFCFPGMGNVSPCEETFCGNLQWIPHPQGYDEYLRSFRVVHENIRKGNSFLTNLTCATPVITNLSLDDIFRHTKAKYKLMLRDKFVMFSPEIFVRIHDGMIYSYPMKGTIDAAVPDAANVIMNDKKEAAEHATITDLIRNDLSQIATEVTVTKYRFIDEVTTNKGKLLQVSSEIRGRLPEDYRSMLGDMFFRLLPAGSITGAPKKKTVDIIRKAENYHRGFYTGVTGVFDGKNLDSAVIIRYVEKMPDGSLVFKSGGGITFMSDAHSEYQEMIQKVYVPVY